MPNLSSDAWLSVTQWREGQTWRITSTTSTFISTVGLHTYFPKVKVTRPMYDWIFSYLLHNTLDLRDMQVLSRLAYTPLLSLKLIRASTGVVVWPEFLIRLLLSTQTWPWRPALVCPPINTHSDFRTFTKQEWVCVPVALDPPPTLLRNLTLAPCRSCLVSNKQ